MERLVAMVLAFALVAPAAPAADGPEVLPAQLVQRVPPRYPAEAIERGQDGWVELRFTVTPEGTTSNIRVVAAFPSGIFERGATNALAKWTYAPRREAGVAVPQADNRTLISFALADSGSVRDPLIPAFAAATAAVHGQKWDDAAKLMKQLTDTRALSLFELAVMEELHGEIAFSRQNFTAAADHFARALEMNANFDLAVRSSVSQLLVMAAVNSGQFERAVRVFDGWNPPDSEQTREVRHTVESVRAALKAGRPITLTPPVR